MKERRTDVQIYHDILIAISNESERESYTGKANHNLTHIQLITGMAYDKLKKRVIIMTKNQLITIKPFDVTLKGYQFLQEYEILQKSKIRLDTILGKEKQFSHQDLARLPVSKNHQMTDMQQVINAQNAIIEHLEK